MSLFLPNSVSNDRKLNKFFCNIRQYVDTLDGTNAGETSLAISDPPLTDNDKKLYGSVSADEIVSILKSYEAQQESTSKKNKPVICDKVLGSSFEKLLHSKKGFHNPGSTDLLVKDLGLQDAHRHSFLGGHAPYNVIQEDDLAGIKKKYDKAKVLNSIKLAHQHLNEKNVDLAEKEFEQAAEILGPSDLDVLIVSGRLKYAKRSFGAAARLFKEALPKANPRISDEIKRHLADCLFEDGHYYYRKSTWQKASDKFKEVLNYDREHHNALLHLRLCHENLQRSRPFGHMPQNSYRK